VERLALKYRPKTFVEVEGQEYPKRIISQLILNNQSCANLLLYGSVGSGKTSLVRLYAGALNCESPSKTGDRCFNCGRCVELEAGDETGFIEIDTPKFRDFNTLRDEIDRLLKAAALTGRRTVIFLDEAHALSKYRDSFAFLLKKVEEPPPGLSFCFATTAIERIDDALQSRTIKLEVRPLTLLQSTNLLDRVARTEGLTLHPDATALLAGLGEHQPRNMLQALDKMRLLDDGSEIVRDRVASVFGVDYIENLIQYFEALGAGDFRRQTIAFTQWQDSIRNKARLIQLFLVGFYYAELCALDVTVEPVIASIRKEERARVMTAFTSRLPHVDLKAFFEGLLDIWPVITVDLSDEALLAVLLRFQIVANRNEAVRREMAPTERIMPSVPPDDGKGARAPNPRNNDDADAPRNPAYLNRGHVRGIFAAASFLVQQGHIPFNALITIRHRFFGKEMQEDASKHFGRFSSDLKRQLEKWGGSGFRIIVQERDEAEGSYGRAVAHVPDPQAAARWLSSWQRKDRVTGTDDNAITLEMVPAGDRLAGHWRCIRWLCGGFNPEDPIFTKLAIEPEFQHAAGDVGTRTRWDCSVPLAELARRGAERDDGVEIVSAFNDAQWDRLYDGWELDERKYRDAQRSLWHAALADVVANHPDDGSAQSKEAQEYEIDELRSRWTARDQTRDWPLWTQS
jgi:DNA polymerase-3 subunit gamma/tau